MATFPTRIYITGEQKQYITGNGIDLRKEMKFLENTEGFEILLRRNFKVHCSCFDSLYNESSMKCQLCGGTGHVNRVEKHLTKRDFSIMDRSFLRNMSDGEFNRTGITLYKYYFQHYVAPTIQDLLYYVTWENNRPKTLIAEYEIISSNPNRADGGRIEYYSCMSKERIVGKPIKKSIVRKIETIDTSYPDAVYQYDLVW